MFLFFEAENFRNKGGWVVDQQFMDLMGSSYLMAHGIGTPVADAETTAEFPSTGEYTVFVRTFNWTSPWYEGEGPGKFEYGVEFNEKNTEQVTMGEWTWETGMNFDQITEFERISDYGLLVVYSNWSSLKNKIAQKEYANRRLDWVAYIAGKRESRRLLGDLILNCTNLQGLKNLEGLRSNLLKTTIIQNLEGFGNLQG